MTQPPSEHRRDVTLDSVEIRPGLGGSFVVPMRLSHSESREKTALDLWIEWDRSLMIKFRKEIDDLIEEEVQRLDKQLFDENKRCKELNKRCKELEEQLSDERKRRKE